MLLEISPAITGVATTLGTAFVLFAVGWVWRQLRLQLLEGHSQNTVKLNAILVQAELTNGTVLHHSEDIIRLDKNNAKLEAQVELLMRLYARGSEP